MYYKFTCSLVHKDYDIKSDKFFEQIFILT